MLANRAQLERSSNYTRNSTQERSSLFSIVAALANQPEIFSIHAGRLCIAQNPLRRFLVLLIDASIRSCQGSSSHEECCACFSSFYCFPLEAETEIFLRKLYIRRHFCSVHAGPSVAVAMAVASVVVIGPAAVVASPRGRRHCCGDGRLHGPRPTRTVARPSRPCCGCGRLPHGFRQPCGGRLLRGRRHFTCS